MEVDVKSEWYESGIVDCARLSSSNKNFAIAKWKQQIDKVKLHTQIMLNFEVQMKNISILKQDIYLMFLLQSWN